MATLTPVVKAQFFDDAGQPLVGGKVYTYAAGTTSPLPTFQDEDATIFNTNPIILDSRGEANIWVGNSQYKFILKTSTNIEIWTVDNISGSLGPISPTIYSPTLNGNVSIVDNSGSPALAIDQTGGGDALRITNSIDVTAAPVVVSSSGQVGIGTLAPQASLDVATGAIWLSDGATPRLKITADAFNTHLSSEGTRGLTLDINSVTKLRVADNGNVGINVAFPSVNLDVGGVTRANIVQTDQISEYTSGNGVFVDSVHCLNGQVDPSNRVITAATQQAVAGSFITFTNVPSWAKRISVIFDSVQCASAIANLQVLIGPSSGLVTAGYLSVASNVTATASFGNGFLIYMNNAAQSFSGTMIIDRVYAGRYIASYSGANQIGNVSVGGGSVSLTGPVASVGIGPTAFNFASGAINLFYE